MGMPMIIGAGIGALGSAAMGKSPFTGALLGGTLGGLGGAGGLFGGASATGAGSGGLLSGLHGVEAAVPSLGSGGYAALGSSAIPAAVAAPTTGIVGSTGEIGSALATTQGGVGTPLTMMDKVGNYITNLPSSAMDYAKANPLSTGKMALDVMTPPPEQPMNNQVAPIRQGNPNAQFAPNWNVNPSSTLSNVSPNVLPQKDNKAGLLSGLQARIPLTDEEKAQLARLGQQYIY